MQTQSGEGLKDDSGPIMPMPDAERMIGARKTAFVGVVILFASLCAGLLLQLLMLVLLNGEFTAKRVFNPTSGLRVARFVGTIWPPLLLLQVVASDRLYRYAVGVLEEGAFIPVALAMMFFVMVLTLVSILALPVFFLFYALLIRRSTVLKADGEISWVAPMLIVLILLITTLFVGAGLNEFQAVTLCAVNSLFAWLFTDATMVNFVAQWRRRGRLKSSEPRVLQFSLQTLLILACGVGVWELLLRWLYS